MTKYYIYALIDPRHPERYYYIGCTTNIKNRLRQHLRNSHVPEIKSWVDELNQAGLVPSFVILECLENEERALKAEHNWIMKSKSDYLVNTRITLRQESAHKLRQPPAGNLDSTTLSRVDQVVMDAILKALKDSNGNKLVAARALGIGRQTLYNKLHRWQSLSEQKPVEPVVSPEPCPDTPTH